MRPTDDLTLDQLRDLLHNGDAPQRVHAAFALGQRLSAEVMPELPLEEEPSSGVRRHWLTILASFGERDAVRAIAEEHASDAEGEHALHLALQLDLASPAWLAARFRDTTAPMQHTLLAADADVDWSLVVPTLEDLLNSDLPSTRQLAASRLHALGEVPSAAMRAYAIRFPDAAPHLLGAWAAGPEHARLLAHLPLYASGRDRGLDALIGAGRRYSLDTLRPFLGEYPALFVLLETPPSREDTWQLIEDLAGESSVWLPEVWVDHAERTLRAPWSPAEEEWLIRWRQRADDWQQRCPDEPGFWPGLVSVLEPANHDGRS